MFFGYDFFDFRSRNAIFVNRACFQNPKIFPGAAAPWTPAKICRFATTRFARQLASLEQFVLHTNDIYLIHNKNTI